MASLCRGAGWDVLAVCDGATGLEAASAEHFDLVLLDLTLPDVSGIDVLVGVSRSRRTPVIVISGRADDLDFARARLAGAHSCLPKPVRAARLLEALSRAVLPTPR